MHLTLSKAETFINRTPFNFWFQRLFDLPVLLKWARLPRRASILEIGCGNGDLAHYLTEKIKPKSMIALDINPQRIAHAEMHYGKDPRLIFQVGNVTNLPFNSSTFDAVIEINTLHLITDWQKALREIRRVLKPRGKLLIRDLSLESFTFPGIGLIGRSLLEHPYEQMFDQNELFSYLRRIGFELTHQYDSSLMLILVAELVKKK